MTTIPTDRSPGPDRLTVAITDAVAAAEECEPAELTPLYRTVDPEALNALFDGRPRADRKVSFEYHGYTILIEEHGLIVVDDAARG